MDISPADVMHGHYVSEFTANTVLVQFCFNAGPASLTVGQH